MNIAVGGIIQRSFRFVGGLGIYGDVYVVGDVGVGVGGQLEMNGLRNLEGGRKGGGCLGRRQLRGKGRDR